MFKIKVEKSSKIVYILPKQCRSSLNLTEFFDKFKILNSQFFELFQLFKQKKLEKNVYILAVQIFIQFNDFFHKKNQNFAQFFKIFKISFSGMTLKRLVPDPRELNRVCKKYSTREWQWRKPSSTHCPFWNRWWRKNWVSPMLRYRPWPRTKDSNFLKEMICKISLKTFLK